MEQKSDLFVAILATASHTKDVLNFIENKKERYLKKDAHISLVGTKLELSSLMSKLLLRQTISVKDSDWHLTQLNAGKLDFPMWGLTYHKGRPLREKPISFSKKASFQECVERLIKLSDTKGEFKVLSLHDEEHAFIKEICLRNFFFFGGI